MTFAFGRRHTRGNAPHLQCFDSHFEALSYSDQAFATLASVLSTLKVPKGLLGWDLEELEASVENDTDRTSDSDDESESEVERMLPAQV